jgi:hypothetical protein
MLNLILSVNIWVMDQITSSTISDYCGLYKKIAVLNQPVYYLEGRKRKLVCYRWDRCIDRDNKSDLKIADLKYQAYDLLLETIKQLTGNKAKRGRGQGKIKFEHAIIKACKKNRLVDCYLGYSEQQENRNAIGTTGSVYGNSVTKYSMKNQGFT